jgi:copper(I)-binding protein
LAIEAFHENHISSPASFARGHAAAAQEKAAARDRPSWSRATPKGADAAAGYHHPNTGTAPDRLVSGTSPVAGKLEIHEMSWTRAS